MGQLEDWACTIRQCKLKSEFQFLYLHIIIKYNLNGSNTDAQSTDGSFTVDDSNSFFSPYKILPIAQENKYFLFYYGIVCCV